MSEPAGTPAPAFYALDSGGWRDYLTLLHPPYTAWHLSYVCIGWAASPRVHGERLVTLLAAFFLAVGIGAHALDELNGRPLRTGIPRRVLMTLACLSVAGAVGIGVYEAARTSWMLLAFVAFGAFSVVAYNLELFGGRFHNDLWFALAWGAFPAFTATWVNTTDITVSGVLATGACFALSVAQRALSTPVRSLRRATATVVGHIDRTDGTSVELDADYLRAAPERALVALSAALPMLALSAVVLRL